MEQSTNKGCACVGGFGKKKSNGGTQWYQQDRVYTMSDICLCIPANIPGGSYRYLEIKKVNNMEETKKTIKIKQATKQGFVELELPGVADLNYVSSKTRRGRVQEGGTDKSNLMFGEYP